jgi:RNA polymerase sigma-70 factor (ECF subfamily)
VSDPRQTAARLRVVRNDADGDPSANAPEPAPHSEFGQLDALYRRFAPYVASIATRLLGRDGEVDDLVQDVFVEALRGIARLREPNAVKGWLAKITVRMSMRRLRKRRVLQTLHLDMEHDEYEHLAGRDATPEQRALVTQIYRVLDRLPARTRVIWTLRHVLDEPLHSIVELTACSQSTVQRKLRDAEALLAKELHDE